MLLRVTVDPKGGRLFKGPNYRLKLPFMGCKRRGSLDAKGRGVGGSFVIDGFGLRLLFLTAYVSSPDTSGFNDRHTQCVDMRWPIWNSLRNFNQRTYVPF